MSAIEAFCQCRKPSAGQDGYTCPRCEDAGAVPYLKAALEAREAEVKTLQEAQTRHLELIRDMTQAPLPEDCVEARNRVGVLTAKCATLRNENVALESRAAELEAERDKFKTALDKINDIRNSIVGLAQIGWSEHIYPLVAALDEAGIKGMPYKEARPHFTGILDRAIKAEGRAAELEAALRALCATLYFCDGSDGRTTCGTLAVREEDGRVYCDAHGRFDDGEEAPDLPYAAPLRAAILLLAKGG